MRTSHAPAASARTRAAVMGIRTVHSVTPPKTFRNEERPS